VAGQAALPLLPAPAVVLAGQGSQEIRELPVAMVPVVAAAPPVVAEGGVVLVVPD
jgi:hypothetical protein